MISNAGLVMSTSESGTRAVGPLPAFPSLGDTMGAFLIGAFLGTLLQGVGFHQTYRYFRLYPGDPVYLKIWVVLLLFMELVNTALVMHTCYFYLITNYFNPVVLLSSPVWSLKILPVPASLSAVITQAFFARRIYLVNRKFRPVAVLAVLLMLSFCGCFIALTGMGWNKPTMAEFLDLSWLASTASGLIMAADLMMTIVLIWFLRRNHTGVTRTDSLLDMLILYAISSGLLICVFNVLNVVSSLLWPDNMIFTAVCFILTKLYSNTFLVSLNARQSLVVDRGGIVNETTPFSPTIVNGSHPSSMSTHRRVTVSDLRYDQPVGRRDSKDIELKVVTQLVVDAESGTDISHIAESPLSPDQDTLV
ncbi:hypothetical protein L226DRAFT_536498 [Lentinus tigrinus ALCF2SS1-7]|uniref:DUF6534 domain-containing protein n=1 Tax=Lentinus tigrinus ALCF2SS1-6 TaxID=1328759 RepID=A0A5C2S6U7_9APHY|nr:hypothetical protein L227DRAFT_654338 [Lentinus tigrinus ALCF2SS1-6]RPD73381.1 hypothetical protein L226DRAFT_536498 [Lentinus tigrinus ALCF2SS1-7]